MAFGKPQIPEGRQRRPQLKPAATNKGFASISKPRLGLVRLLPTPIEVEKALDAEVGQMAACGRPVVGEARERLLEDFKLQYHFGGKRFAYRETDQGKEILAVGDKDMKRLFRKLTAEEDEVVTSGFADPW
jgi:hypothetical protein